MKNKQKREKYRELEQKTTKTYNNSTVVFQGFVLRLLSFWRVGITETNIANYGKKIIQFKRIGEMDAGLHFSRSASRRRSSQRLLEFIETKNSAFDEQGPYIVPALRHNFLRFLFVSAFSSLVLAAALGKATHLPRAREPLSACPDDFPGFYKAGSEHMF